MSEAPLLSVAVITHDRKAGLLRLLDSVLAQGHPPARTEIVILDDASSDGTAAAVEELFAGLRKRGFFRLEVARTPKALNVAGARSRNLLMVSPTADWVLSSDDDAVLEPGSLATLLEAGRDPKVAVVGPKIVFLSRPDKVFMSANFVSRWTCRYWGVDSPAPLDCDWVNTTLCLIRGEALRRLGSFRGEFYCNHEEVEFCLRARNAGWKVLYLPGATALHDVEPDFSRPQRLYYLYRNKFIVIRETFAGLGRWTALAFHGTFGLVLALARLALRSLTGSRDPSETWSVVWAAFADGIRDVRGERLV